MPSLTGKALRDLSMKERTMVKIRKLEAAGKMKEAMSMRADMMMTTPAPGPHRKLNLSG